MRIAISSKGKELSSEIDQRFGRTRYLIVYDTSDDNWQAIDNSAAEMAHGAGVQAAQTVVNQKVDVVVSSNFGPKAFLILQAAKIKVAQLAQGTVSEAIDLARNNQLTFIDGASVPQGGPQ